MKKIFALILVCGILLAGCGGSDAPANQPGEAPAEASTAAQAEKTVSLGELEGNTYTNSYAGLGITFDENWDVYPADQLQTLPENLKEAFEGTDLESEEFNNIMDFLAENVNDLTTMNLNYTKLSMQERLTYAVMDEESLIDAMLGEYSETLVDAYANMGIAVESMDKKTVTFLGEERCAMYTVASVEDVPYYVLQFYNYDLGAYGVTLTVASYVEDKTESLLELYYPVE